MPVLAIRRRRSGYQRQMRDYRSADARLAQAVSRAGRAARTFAAKRLRSASGYPATLIKRNFRYASPRPRDARLQWTRFPHAVDVLGWIGRRYRSKAREGQIRVKKWPGTGGGKVFTRSWVTEGRRGLLLSRHSASEVYRVKARGIARLMTDGGLVEPTRAEFVGRARSAVAGWLSRRGGR